ncbi:unnamed protein product [Mytilus edulis]|uniref:Uncharacterized protein n=1 Tax=Mytilus edulis TaxID=6550 RepID=A0A8S3R9W1_MYTED|nr:unnamed protein product [Mytilus edulis]
MFDSLYIEIAAFKALDSWLEDSGWTIDLVNAQVTSAEPATENASIALYQYMCQYIVGTEEHVKRMRMMNTIRDNLSSNDNTLIITSGSFVEGIEMRGSDLDIMIIWTLMEVCENKNNNFNPDTVYFAMETNDTQPGFTQLRFLHRKIRMVSKHHSQWIFTRSTTAEEAEEAASAAAEAKEADKAEKAEKGGKGKKKAGKADKEEKAEK